MFDDGDQVAVRGEANTFDWVGDAVASLHVPLAWRSWTLRVDGAKALVLDRAGWGLAGRVGRMPRETDTDLLVSFAMAVVWTRVRFRVRPMRSVHVVEERAGTLDMLLDLDPDFDGDDDAV